MKLVTYERKGKPRAGALVDGDRKIVDLADANGIARVECCLHPWMRAEVRIK